MSVEEQQLNNMIDGLSSMFGENPVLKTGLQRSSILSGIEYIFNPEMYKDKPEFVEMAKNNFKLFTVTILVQAIKRIPVEDIDEAKAILAMYKAHEELSVAPDEESHTHRRNVIEQLEKAIVEYETKSQEDGEEQ